MEILQKFRQSALAWFMSHGPRIVIIMLAAYLLYRFSFVFIERFIRQAVKSNHFLTKEAEKKREDTLIGAFDGTTKVLIWVITVIMILSEGGINVGPILAAAGVAGLALGFGAQYLIKDVISGLFIILENQYRVGDVVCLNGDCGVVENITLRMTVLRDMDGTVHHVSNGEVKNASNMSKYFSRVNINVGISYNENLEKVISVVNAVGKQLAEDPEWAPHIIKPMEFLRIDDFADSAVIIKILGETKPLKQWDVAGEFRKRLKMAFDKDGIEFPFPQTVVHIEK